MSRGIVTDCTSAGEPNRTTIVGVRSSFGNETPRVDVTWNSTFSPVGNSFGKTVICLLTVSSTACISAQRLVVVPVVRPVAVLALLRLVPAVVDSPGIVTRVEAGVLAPFVVTVPFDGGVLVVPDVAVDCVLPVGMLAVERPRVVPTSTTKHNNHSYAGEGVRNEGEGVRNEECGCEGAVSLTSCDFSTSFDVENDTLG